MEKTGSFFAERVEAQVREPSRLWHFLPVIAGLCFAAFGVLSTRPSRIIDLTAPSMRPSVTAASIVLAILALGTLLSRPRRARFAVASSLLMIAASIPAFLPYRSILTTPYINMSVHEPVAAAAIAGRMVSLGKPDTADETRLDVVLARYAPLGQQDRVPARTFGMSYWPPEEIGGEFTPHSGETGARVSRARAFMLARSIMWYAPGDSIPVFVVCDYEKAPVPLGAWVNVEGNLGPGTIEATTGFVPTIWADRATPGKAPAQVYLRRRY
jgi:hypothetical protein